MCGMGCEEKAELSHFYVRGGFGESAKLTFNA